MPELPEVEPIKNSLAPQIIGLQIQEVTISLPKLIQIPSAEELMANIKHKTILQISRRGKYLLFHLSQHLIMVVHLRMTGRLVYCSPDTPMEKHTHIIFDLNNQQQLRYTDIRQFGRILLTSQDQMDQLPGLKDLGVEPLEDNFNLEFLQKNLAPKRTRLKALLLNQAFIAGLGNIYTDEALYRAGLYPGRLGNSLSPHEMIKLHQAIQEVLTQGIQNRGTSLKDYVDGNGSPGSYQNKLLVYGRAGQACPQCGESILRIQMAGRSTFFCPQCQKP